MRALILLAFVAISSVVIGRISYQASGAVMAFSQYGYYFVLAAFLLFAGCLYVFLRSTYDSREKLRGLAALWPVLPVLAFCILFTARGSELQFKTVMDEHVIAMTARTIHLKRVLVSPMQMHHLNNIETTGFNVVDKRPVFFPFLVSILHDLFGYSPERSLHLNAFILTPLLFVLLYILGNRICGTLGAVLFPCIIASIPLVSTVCNSGGLELLNLLLLTACLLLADNFLRESNNVNCGLLCFGAILLANTRYESVLFILPVGLACAYVWYSKRKIQVYWPLYLSPVLLIPYLWQNQLFKINDDNWQLEGKEAPFALEFVQANFERSIHYFFNFNRNIPNSWLISFFGILAAVYLIVYVRRLASAGKPFGTALNAFLCFLPAYILLYALFLAYSWDFGGKVVQRLVLPLNIPLVFCMLYLLREMLVYKPVRYAAIMLFTAYTLMYAFPSTSRRVYELENASNTDYQAAELILESGDLGPKPVIIADNSFFFIIHGVAATPTARVNKHPEKLAWYLRQPIARNVYYFNVVCYSPDDDDFFPALKHQLSSDFELELVDERFVSSLRKVQISKVVGYNGPDLPDEGDYTYTEYIRKLASCLP